jgi:predicted regulator of Ras-like GTPase activity (Roadblock/LC7/MglB family)
METILQSINELAGVTAAFVFHGSGQLAGYRAQAIYDETLLGSVSESLVKALESVQLQIDDWEAVSASFDDGRLLLRSLGRGADGQPQVLAVVADARLNAPFATVALRVAVQKLKKLLAGGSASSSSLPALEPAGQARSRPALGALRPLSQPALQATPPQAAQSQPAVSSSGMTWSRPGSSSGSSGIEVLDAASSALLTRCSKELARHVGPMAKVYVKEAARRVSPTGPFGLAQAKALIAELSGHIEDTGDRAAFRKAVENF